MLSDERDEINYLIKTLEKCFLMKFFVSFLNEFISIYVGTDVPGNEFFIGLGRKIHDQIYTLVTGKFTLKSRKID